MCWSYYQCPDKHLLVVRARHRERLRFFHWSEHPPSKKKSLEEEEENTWLAMGISKMCWWSLNGKLQLLSIHDMDHTRYYWLLPRSPLLELSLHWHLYWIIVYDWCSPNINLYGNIRAKSQFRPIPCYPIIVLVCQLVW